MINEETLRLFAANAQCELTEEERGRLATAILEHEELFSAFADEQLFLAASADATFGPRIEAALKSRQVRTRSWDLRWQLLFSGLAGLLIIGCYFLFRPSFSPAGKGNEKPLVTPVENAENNSHPPIHPEGGLPAQRPGVKAGSKPPTSSLNSLATILLFPATRGGSAQVLQISSYTRIVRLEINIEPGDFRSYLVVVKNATGKRVLERASTPKKNSISVDVPVAYLPAGEYTLWLNGLTSDHESHPIDRFVFRTVRTSRVGGFSSPN